MKLALLRHRINRCLDTLLPMWERSALNQDEKLPSDASTSASLESRLRDEAPQWAKLHSDDAAYGGPLTKANILVVERAFSQANSAAHAYLAMGVVLAGCIAMAWAASRFRTVSDRELAVNVRTVELEQVQEVHEGFSALTRVWAESVQDAEESLIGFNDSMDPTRLKLVGADSIRHAINGPIDSASRSYGRSLAFIDLNLRRTYRRRPERESKASP